MKIHTIRFGTIDIDENKIVIVPEGIIGFPDIKRYAILDMGEDIHFKLFQAVDEYTLGFVIIDPLLFKPDYKVKIRMEDLHSLNTDNIN